MEVPKVSQNVQQVLHGVVVLALIGAYTALTVLNHDGNPILGVLLGYTGAVGVANAPTK